MGEKVLEKGEKKPLTHNQCSVLRQSRKMFLRMSKSGLNIPLTNVTLANYPTQCPIMHKMVTVNQSQPQADGTMKMVLSWWLLQIIPRDQMLPLKQPLKPRIKCWQKRRRLPNCRLEVAATRKVTIKERAPPAQWMQRKMLSEQPLHS